MAAHLRVHRVGGGGDGGGGHGLALCVLQDLLGAVAYLAAHPLHAAYGLFFSRHILSLAAFFCPLLVSTALLLVVLVTAAPYVSPGWARPGASSFGRTCGIAVGALCAELRPDGAAAGLVAQLCSFVLGSADGAAVLRVHEIMGELCDATTEHAAIVALAAAELPLQQTPEISEKIFSPPRDFDEIKDEIEDKVVVCEDLKIKSSQNHTFVQEMEDDEDHLSLEIKKCELVTSNSSVSRRIRQWEAQVCGNFIQVPDETEQNSLEFSSGKDPKENLQLEIEDFGENLRAQAQEIAMAELRSEGLSSGDEQSVQEPQEQRLEKDAEVEEHERDNGGEARGDAVGLTSIARRVHSRNSSGNLVGEGGSPGKEKEKEWKRTLACKLYEERMQLKLCRDRAVVGCSDDMDMLWEAYDSAAGDADAAAGDVKLGTDMARKQEDSAEQRRRDGEQQQHEEHNDGDEEDEEEEEEGSVRQLCCLQALKFSTRKMNLGGGGKPSLAKITKVLRRMAALSRVGSRRGHKGVK